MPHRTAIDPGTRIGGRPLPLTDLIGCKGGSIEKLCELGDEDLERVLRNAIRRINSRRYQLRDEKFSAEFLVGAATAFCPACLLEDDSQSSDPATVRRGRLIWQLRPVRVCPVHQLALRYAPKVEWIDIAHELASRVPERSDGLRRLADEQPLRLCSPLQNYVIDRLEGASGPAWLDRQTIEQAMRSTEMLGVLLEFGQKPNLDEFSPNHWDRAGRVGFEITSGGEGSIREALVQVQREHQHVLGLGGPQSYFGRLYQWLEFGRSGKDPGPIKAVLRDHILDNFEVAPGKAVLGEVLDHRRRHSVPSLAREAGVHPKTLHNLLVTMGMIPPDPEGRVGQVTFDAAAGERIANAMRRAVPLLHLPRALNSTRAQAEQLVEAGLLVPLHGAEVRDKGRVSRAVDQADIDAFLRSLEQHARQVDEAPQGFLNFPQAAEKVRMGAAMIVKLVLDGKLPRTCRLSEVPGYSGILVDPAEVWEHKEEGPGGLGVNEAFTVLKVSHAVGMALIADRPGGAILRTTLVSSHRTGRRTRRVLEKDIEAFRAEFATLGHLCRETGLHVRRVSRRLAEAGVPPAYDPGEIGTLMVRRSDLPDLAAA